MVYLELLPPMRTPRAAISRLDWRPCRFKWTGPFSWKTKSGFCACANWPLPQHDFTLHRFVTDRSYTRLNLWFPVPHTMSREWIRTEDCCESNEPTRNAAKLTAATQFCLVLYNLPYWLSKSLGYVTFDTRALESSAHKFLDQWPEIILMAAGNYLFLSTNVSNANAFCHFRPLTLWSFVAA